MAFPRLLLYCFRGSICELTVRRQFYSSICELAHGARVNRARMRGTRLVHARARVRAQRTKHVVQRLAAAARVALGALGAPG